MQELPVQAHPVADAPSFSIVQHLRSRSSFFDRLVVLTRPVRQSLRSVTSWGSLLLGMASHAVVGVTPKFAHQALVLLFMKTGGRSNDALASMVASIHPPYKLPPAKGVLGDLNKDDLARIEATLERDGYYVFENALSAEFCDNLLRRSLDFNYQLMGDEAVAIGVPQFGKFDRANPKATQYSLTRDDTTDLPEIQELISDPSLIAVAQNYLRSKPIFTGVWFGWSAKVKDTPDDKAAQEYHWDMERIKWLRFFIYLNDVGPENGPHCFIRGSHRTGMIPRDLLDLGYVRHRDGTIIQRFGHENFREFTAGKGTIIAEDSRGFHKGKVLTQGDRLMIAFELSNTTFGVNKRHRIRNIRIPRFGEFARKYPRLYRNLDFP